MYLDDYRLKPMAVGLDLVDPIYQQALENRSRVTKFYIAWFALSVAYVCLFAVVGGSALKSLQWLFMAIMIAMPVPGFVGNRKVVEKIVSRSVTTRLLRLVVTYTIPDHLHVELDYPFSRIARIVVQPSGISIYTKGIGMLEMPIGMFSSENDMKGFAEALAIASNGELAVGKANVV